MKNERGGSAKRTSTASTAGAYWHCANMCQDRNCWLVASWYRHEGYSSTGRARIWTPIWGCVAFTVAVQTITSTIGCQKTRRDVPFAALHHARIQETYCFLSTA